MGQPIALTDNGTRPLATQTVRPEQSTRLPINIFDVTLLKFPDASTLTSAGRTSRSNVTPKGDTRSLRSSGTPGTETTGSTSRNSGSATTTPTGNRNTRRRRIITSGATNTIGRRTTASSPASAAPARKDRDGRHGTSTHIRTAHSIGG